MEKVIEPELSYKIVGFCMLIHSELGKGCKEKYYQRALEVILKNNKINFQKEIKVDLNFENNKIGHYYLDFLIENKIVVELKTKPFLSKSDYNQVLNYLITSNLKLGILINFGKDSLEYKRIINYKISH